MRWMIFCVALLPTLADASYNEYRIPWNANARRATVMSEGVPLVAHVLQVKEHAGKRLPTIIITGHDEPENEARCRALGATAYLRKPLDDDQLLRTIGQATHHRIAG